MTAFARTAWRAGLFLAWAGALAACGSGGAGGGGGTGGDGGTGGTGGTCQAESDAELCQGAGAECGSVTATDRCGSARVLDCGGCEDPLWCGGGGEPNRCGATCPTGCPEGWTCEQAACTGDRTRIPLDLETVRVGGKVLLEGVAPVASPGCVDFSARVTFVEATTSATFNALIPCGAAEFTFETDLAPGTYQVSVGGYRAGDSNLPEGHFIMEPALVVDGPRSDLVYDIRTVPVAGRITLNGVAPEVALDCYDFTARIQFVETTTGTQGGFLIPCDDPDFSFEVRVPPGTYQVWASKYRTGDGSNLPDGAFVVASDLRVDGEVSGLVFDVATVEIAGRLLLKGHLPEASPDCYDYTAYVGIMETSGKAFVNTLVPCEALDFGFRLAAPPGTYEAWVSKYRPDDSNLPEGTFIVEDNLRITGATEDVVLDLRTVRISGALRWNGATPRVSTGCYDYTTSVRFTGFDGSSAEALIPCESTEFEFDVELLPGTYDVSVSKYRTEDSDLPDGTFVVGRQLSLDGFTGNLALELTTVPVSGTVTVNGLPPTVAEYCYDYTAMVQFQEFLARPQDAAAITSVTTRIPCSAADFAWEAQVPPGDYRIGVMPYRQDASDLPSGNFVPVGRLSVR
jgi:hypothetical protein